MYRISFLLLSLLGFYLTVFGQNPGNKNGLILDDEGYEQVPLRPFPDERGLDLPGVVSLRSFAPTAGDQGDYYSCAAWALANALTISKARKYGLEDRREIDIVRHSPAYIYNQGKEGDGCQVGMKFNDGLDLMQTMGDCLEADFSYEQYFCDQQPRQIHHNQAANYRIEGFERIMTSNYHNEKKIDAIRESLFNGLPVVVGMEVPLNFREAEPGRLYWSDGIEHHAMVIVGYNDWNYTFEILNSYGTEWGDNGFFKMDYDVMARRLIYGYVLHLGEEFGDGSGQSRN